METNERQKARQKIIDRLKEITGHSHIKLTNCCNSAILIALHIAKQHGIETILIQDQGGWLTYKTFPEMLGLKLDEIKTDYGIIDLKDLEKKATPKTALLINSLAGYIAPLPLVKISEICKAKGCLLIEDASGSLGVGGLSCGMLSDIIVASFGKWKPVNNNYGGFISAEKKELLDIDPELWQMSRFAPEFEEALLSKLDGLDARRKKLQAECQKAKSGLEAIGLGKNIIHKDKQGLNVIVKFSSEAEKEKIINHCRSSGYEFTLCPRYIRVMDKAVSIEIKRLE